LNTCDPRPSVTSMPSRKHCSTHTDNRFRAIGTRRRKFLRNARAAVPLLEQRQGDRNMKTRTEILGAACLALLIATPAAAEPDRAGREDRAGPPAAKAERPPSFDRDGSDRRGFDGDRRRGADARIERRDRPDGSRLRTGRRDRDFVVRHGQRHIWGGITFYLSDGYYYGECGWLKRRAIRTDSPVWWNRYRRCRDFS